MQPALRYQVLRRRHSAAQPGIVSPADAGDIIAFAVGAVDGKQHIRYLPVKRSGTVNRRFAQVALKQHAVFIRLLRRCGKNTPRKHLQHQMAAPVAHYIVGSQLPLQRYPLSLPAKPRQVRPYRHRQHILRAAQPARSYIKAVKAFRVNLVAVLRPAVHNPGYAYIIACAARLRNSVLFLCFYPLCHYSALRPFLCGLPLFRIYVAAPRIMPPLCF